MSLLKNQEFGTPLMAALNRAREEEGQPALPPPVDTRSYKDMIKNGVVEWEHKMFGSLMVTVKNCELHNSGSEGPNYWSQIHYHGTQPREMVIQLKGLTEDGVRLLHAKHEQLLDVTNRTIQNLVVPIKWVGAESWVRNGRATSSQKVLIPRVRAKGVDNVDIIFLGQDGRFAQIQISLCTRNGVFWVVLQEIYSGHIARTTQQKAKETGLTYIEMGKLHAGLVAPLYAEYAYPGADYLRTFTNIGSRLVNIGMDTNSIVPLSKCTTAEWKPYWHTLTEKEIRNGWKSAVVLYFNAVLGSGLARCEDGKVVFFHQNDIVGKDNRPISSNRGEFPMISPMAEIVLTLKKGSNERPRAACVRKI